MTDVTGGVTSVTPGPDSIAFALLRLTSFLISYPLVPTPARELAVS